MKRFPEVRWKDGFTRTHLSAIGPLIPLALEVSNDEDNGLRHPTRLATQPISSGNSGISSPHCVRCNARVCIEDIRREMLKTSVLKFVRRSVPNDPTDPTDSTSFHYVCPVCPVCGFVQVYELSQRARFTVYA